MASSFPAEVLGLENSSNSAGARRHPDVHHTALEVHMDESGKAAQLPGGCITMKKKNVAIPDQWHGSKNNVDESSQRFIFRLLHAGNMDEKRKKKKNVADGREGQR